MTARPDATPTDSALRRLAVRRGIETSYLDATGVRRVASAETLLGVLRSLGEPISAPRDAEKLLDAEGGDAGDQMSPHPALPAVVVAWDGQLSPVLLGPEGASLGVTATLTLEQGEDGGQLVQVETRRGSVAVTARGPLPFGLHVLAVSLPNWPRSHCDPAATADKDEPGRITIISAPSRSNPIGPRAWGVFAPTYALTDDRSGGQGDLTCLGRFGRFAGSAGASYVATLPILAEFSRADEPNGAPTPYSPLSRMWWHEGYLDGSSVPELRDLVGPGVRPGAGGRADPGRRAAELRPLLAAAARAMHEAGGRRLEEYETFVASRPGVVDYARFRAAAEQAGPDWGRWPASLRRGLIDESELDPEALRAHCYAQFVTDDQVRQTADLIRAAGAAIILDLPVGCRSDGFDTWAYAQSYSTGATIGAPPDGFFSAGQDWGCRPLHPEGERRSGYEVTAGALGHLLRHAGALRLDHAMALARLWWIPDGMSAAEGAYVRYRSEELIALCCLEAWRHGASLVGEDLGTVERSFTDLLGEHDIAGMHVAVFDLDTGEATEPLSPRRGSVALVDTHDTATFAGWFTGYDVEDRLGPEARCSRARRSRARRVLVERLVASGLLCSGDVGDAVAVHEALAVELARSEAGVVLLNLEDCLGELDPQNVPGTSREHANFCRLVAEGLPELERDGRVLSLFSKMRAARP